MPQLEESQTAYHGASSQYKNKHLGCFKNIDQTSIYAFGASLLIGQLTALGADALLKDSSKRNFRTC